MLVLKLQEKEFFQRFFLDAGTGFWEEWNEEDTFYDISDLEMLNLTEELKIEGKKVSSITCIGSIEELSTLNFIFEDVGIQVKYSNEKDIDSDVILENL